MTAKGSALDRMLIAWRNDDIAEFWLFWGGGGVEGAREASRVLRVMYLEPSKTGIDLLMRRTRCLSLLLLDKIL